MRISIWQQFSSNHSADFEMVGLFPTEGQAQQAATELERWLKMIADWYGDPQNEKTIIDMHERFIQDEDSAPRSPPEVEMDRTYGIGFSEYELDWLWDSERVSKAIIVDGQFVFLSNITDSFQCRCWSGEQPFDRLLEKLGAKVRVSGGIRDQGSAILVSCSAPDELTARRIFDEVTELHRHPFKEDPSIPRICDQGCYEIVEREGLQLRFYIIKHDMWRALSDLIAYLNRHRCTNLTYDLPDTF